MNNLLWVLQVVFGLYFIAVGIMHFAIPANLPDVMSWMYDLPQGLHVLSGVAELLGGLGLILPGVTGIQTRLTPLAASGLAVTMVGAAIWHIPRGEIVPNVFLTLLNAAIMAFIAYGRWQLVPLKGRG